MLRQREFVLRRASGACRSRRAAKHKILCNGRCRGGPPAPRQSPSARLFAGGRVGVKRSPFFFSGVGDVYLRCPRRAFRRMCSTCSAVAPHSEQKKNLNLGVGLRAGSATCGAGTYYSCPCDRFNTEPLWIANAFVLSLAVRRLFFDSLYLQHVR